MATKEIKAKTKYTKPLGRYALPNWKLCHIQPVGFNTNTSIEDLEISAIEDHFRKYVNPNNMFILPKEIGYLGEIDVFIKNRSDKNKANSFSAESHHYILFSNHYPIVFLLFFLT